MHGVGNDEKDRKQCYSEHLNYIFITKKKGDVGTQCRPYKQLRLGHVKRPMFNNGSPIQFSHVDSPGGSTWFVGQRSILFHSRAPLVLMEPMSEAGHTVSLVGNSV